MKGLVPIIKVDNTQMRALEDFTNRGIFVNVDGTYDYQSGSYHYTMEMTVEGRADNNDTSVSCMVYDTGTPVESSVAYVYIAGQFTRKALVISCSESLLHSMQVHHWPQALS